MPKPPILIVEADNLLARDLRCQVIELGYERVEQAATGEEALLLAEQLRPEWVLVDIHLGGGSLEGIRTAQKIRERFSIPVIFRTPCLEDPILDQAKIAQPYGYFAQPFSSRKLGIVINLALTKHQTEMKLRHLLEEQATILRTAMDGFWMVDMQGRLVEVNDAYCQMCGYSREELLRMSIADLEADESLKEIAATIDQVKQAGCARFERRQRCKDGRIIHFELSANYLPASEGRLFCFLRDITERKQTLEELGCKTALLEAQLNSTLDGILIVDSQGKKILQNQRVIDLWQIPPSIAEGKDDERQVKHVMQRTKHPERFVERINYLYHHPEEISREEIELTDGTVLDRYSAPVLSKDGQNYGRIWIFRDITERKRAAAAISESRDLIVKVTAQVPGVVYQYRLYPDGHSCFPFASSGIYSIYEVTPEEVREDATPVFGRLHPEDYDQIVDSILESGRTLQPFHCEFRVILPKQGLRWRLCDALPMRTEDGGTLWHGIISDITEHKRAEEKTRQLSSAVEQSPVSIVITNLQGEIEYVNPKFTALTGYTLEEVRGQNPRVIKGEKTSTEEYRQLWESITQGREWRGEFHNRKKNGEYYWESALISPIVDAKGRITHFLAVKEDITERKMLKAQFQQAQKMESVGQLAGGVAHDFNNILAAIMMHLSLLQENEALGHETQELLTELMGETKRATQLTGKLLTFSRQSILEAKVLDLNEVVVNMLKMLGRLIGEHIILHFDHQDGLPAVEADPGMIEQVLMNLVVNARDAMPKGGRITIATQPIQIEQEQIKAGTEARPGLFVCLSVTDNGCGMDETTLQRIFEPFFTTKEPGKGTGLGLATVYGIVSQHKGWVEAMSEVGKGTIFRVYLPATSKKAAEASPKMKMATRRGHETILLVEDETGVRKVMAQGLRRLGYGVLEAGNGQEAMRLWQEHGPQIDLLFSDMVMPEGMTGLDLAEKLKEEKSNLKVIISSGYHNEVASQARLASGGIIYLPKPYAIGILAKTVRDCLDE